MRLSQSLWKINKLDSSYGNQGLTREKKLHQSKYYIEEENLHLEDRSHTHHLSGIG